MTRKQIKPMIVINLPNSKILLIKHLLFMIRIVSISASFLVISLGTETINLLPGLKVSSTLCTGLLIVSDKVLKDVSSFLSEKSFFSDKGFEAHILGFQSFILVGSAPYFL